MADAKKEDVGEKMKKVEGFDGPLSKRGCTDPLCMLLMLVCWVGMSAVGYYGNQEGDYRVIINPMDYDGNICGMKYGDAHDMTDYPYLYPMNQYGAGVCVKKCPEVPNLFELATIGADGFQQETLVDLSEIFSVDDIPTHVYDADCSGGMFGCYTSGYAFYLLDTQSVMSRCVPSQEALSMMAEKVQDSNGEKLITEEVSVESSDDSNFMNHLYSDFWVAKGWIIGFGFCVAMVISFVYSFLLRVPGILFILVWSCIISVQCCLSAIAIYAWYEHDAWKSEDPQTHSDGEITGMKAAYAVMAAAAAVYFVLICFLRSRIQLAIAVVKQACQAVASMNILVLFPVIQCAGYILFMGTWIVYAVGIASLGELKEAHYCFKGAAAVPVTSEELCTAAGGFWYKYRSFEYDENTTNAGWYLLFSYFWTSEFILAIGEIVVAMAIAKWYFSRDKTKIGNGTVLQAIRQSFFYHTGTAAFGALIIAIIKMIRAALAYAQKKAKASGNKLAQAVLCMMQCYMWCLEKCMKFLNKNAYIQTAIFGSSFCTAAKNAFFLILRNIARIGACSMVSEFIMVLGKIFIVSVTACAAYFGLDNVVGDELYSPIGPVIFIMILSWFTASMFMNVFSMAIATILQCFIADEEMYDQNERYAQKELADFINKNSTDEAKTQAKNSA